MKKRGLLLCSSILLTILASCNNGGSVVSGDYTLTLNAEGGKFSDSSSTKTLTKVSQITSSGVLETPTRAASETASYTFNGWYDGNTTSSTKITFPYTLKKDTTFYANWTETPFQTYTVTLNANGGKFADGKDTTDITKVYKLKQEEVEKHIPTYENHIFLGWYYSTTYYNDEVSFPLTVKKDLTIYAMWGEGKGYTVNISPEGGTFSDKTTDTKVLLNQYKITYDDIDVPTKTNDQGQNYTFIGWSKESSGKTLVYGSEILRSNINLYAVYRDPSEDAFGIYATDGGTVTTVGNVYTLSTAGTYTVCGTLSEGQIYVDAGDNDDVNIVLNGMSLTSCNNVPLYVNNADKVKVKAQKNTTNYIYDNRVINDESEEATGGGIYSKSDLDFAGKGYLQVESTANNGIHSSKDIEIKNLTLYVKGLDNGIKGNNSISIESGNISVVAISGDGLKTSENDLTSKSKQKGDIRITGGKVDIDAYGDGIQAAHDVIIESGVDDDGNTTTPTIDIKTNKYADTGGSPIEKSTLYIRSTQDLRSYKNVIVYSYNNDGTSTTNVATYKGIEEVEGGGGMGPGPRKTTYYVWTLEKPQDFKNVKVYIGDSTTSYSYYTDGKTYNDSYNMITLSRSFSSSKLDFSWGVHDTSSEVSAKGIKSSNKININDGSLTIKSFDDGIRANGDETIESTGEYGEGAVNLNGGTIDIYTDDKAVHGDNYLTMNNGTVNITNCYEGYEASVITINGGTTHIYTTDDGLNAGSKDSSITQKQININGGYVDIQTGSGDTDGIDSNGTYTQKGGIVISRASNNENMSTALDTDGQSTISDSAVFIALGVQPEADREKRMSYGNVSTSTISYSANSTHTINDTYTFTVTQSYSKMYVYLGSNATAPTVK